MLTDGKILDLLYRHTAPEKILEILKRNIRGGLDGPLRSKAPNEKSDEYFTIKNQPIDDKVHFIDYAETTLQGYSEDEQWLLYEHLKQRREYWEKKGIGNNCGFLLPLIEYAVDHLKIIGGEPVCRQGKVLDWRDAYLRLGQDFFVTAYLAWEDFRNNSNRRDFSWPVILHVDNQDLYKILKKGMAENHNHLAGGTQSYQVTWCRMMNYPKKIRVELSSFLNSNLYYRIHRGEKYERLDIFDELELAALIRTILFRALHRDEFSNNFLDINIDFNAENSESRNNDLYTQKFNRTFDGRIAFANEYLESFCMRNNLEDTVDCLRKAYGVQVCVLGEDEYCLDYALEDIYLQACKNQDIRILIGERAFLYKCMRACLEGNIFTEFESELFYLYIVLQCNFRSEMIQTNNQTGFKNFKNYQDRKDDAWDATPYYGDAMRLALNNRLNTENISSLEGRVVPKAEMEKNIEKVYRSDLAKRFADCPPEKIWNRKEYDFYPELDMELFENASWFYVFHFFKIPDNRKLDPMRFDLPACRHAEHRRLVMNQARGFVRALRESSYFRLRVRGIDSASEEVFCRPEIFAVSFRYIDAIQKKWNASDNDLLISSPIRISKTYHAGEDFLDIASGLRSIDEAIRFLKLGPHCRIGHALALGVEPEIHYRTKHYEIITTKQERLDDLVWILFRGKELGVNIERSLETKLGMEADGLFREIYVEALRDNYWDSNLSNYWNSMKLRGDDPSVYSSGSYKVTGMDVDEIKAYLVDFDNSELEHYREDSLITGLYYHYHFDIRARIRGNETYIVRVSNRYIDLIREIQEAMMKEIQSGQLIIECNPSSNVLIGTFKDYCLHPVFRFNNRKLYGRLVSHCGKNVQLNVCVNTDDLGVFDTTLEFEYALLYEALQKRRDYMLPMGNHQDYTVMGGVKQDYQKRKDDILVYSDLDILEYLDDLREMGLRAVFPPNT